MGACVFACGWLWSGGNGNLLVSKFGQVGSGQYLDPSSGSVFTFNHLTRQFGEETDKKQVLSEDIEANRAAIQKALEAYISDLYKANKATVAVYGADNGTITICLSAKNVNLSNFWSVKRWTRCEWPPLQTCCVRWR